MRTDRATNEHGFSLLEMVIVLAIFGAVSGSLLVMSNELETTAVEQTSALALTSLKQQVRAEILTAEELRAQLTLLAQANPPLAHLTNAPSHQPISPSVHHSIK